MSTSESIKTLEIKLNVNMKGHQEMVYAPYMTLPGETSKTIYFIPTIPLNKDSISEAWESIYKKKPLEDDIKSILFNKVDTVKVISKMIEIARLKRKPIFPLQFTDQSDLIDGKNCNSMSCFKNVGEYINGNVFSMLLPLLLLFEFVYI